MQPVDYNYPIFPPDDDVDAFANFRDHLPVGASAPDPEVLDLASDVPLRLRELTRRGLTVLEFGSLT